MAASDKELKIQQTTAKRVRLLRTMQGVSLAALGMVCGCAGQQIQKCETGKNQFSASRLKIIADFLNVPIGAFYDEELSQPTALIQSLIVIGEQTTRQHRALCDLVFAMAEAETLMKADARMEA